MVLSKRLAACALIAAVALPVAALATQPGWYISLDGGQVQYKNVSSAATRWLSNGPPRNAGPGGGIAALTGVLVTHHENSDTGYRVTVGYQFNPYLGVEAGYTRLGSIVASGQGTAAYSPPCSPSGICLPIVAILPYNSSARLTAHGLELAATGSLPLSQKWSLFARLGAFDAHTELDVTGAPQGAAGWVPRHMRGTTAAPNGNQPTASARIGRRSSTGRCALNGIATRIWAPATRLDAST